VEHNQTLRSFHAGYFLIKAIENLNLNQSKIARSIGVNPSVINEICKERRGISPEMAIKLGTYLGGVGLNTNFWYRIQWQYEIEEASKKVNVGGIEPVEVKMDTPFDKASAG